MPKGSDRASAQCFGARCQCNVTAQGGCAQGFDAESTLGAIVGCARQAEGQRVLPQSMARATRIWRRPRALDTTRSCGCEVCETRRLPVVMRNPFLQSLRADNLRRRLRNTLRHPMRRPHTPASPLRRPFASPTCAAAPNPLQSEPQPPFTHTHTHLSVASKPPHPWSNPNPSFPTWTPGATLPTRRCSATCVPPNFRQHRTLQRSALRTDVRARGRGRSTRRGEECFTDRSRPPPHPNAPLCTLTWLWTPAPSNEEARSARRFVRERGREVHVEGRMVSSQSKTNNVSFGVKDSTQDATASPASVSKSSLRIPCGAWAILGEDDPCTSANAEQSSSSSSSGGDGKRPGPNCRMGAASASSKSSS